MKPTPDTAVRKPLTVDDIPEGSDAMIGAFAAREYYNGMMSAIYAMSSTGSLELFPGEGLDRIIGEVRVAIRCATDHYPEDLDSLEAFLTWLKGAQS